MAKNVIIIGPAFPLRGGIANFNNLLAQNYYHRGDNIKIYSFSLQYPSFLFPGTTQYEDGDAPKDISIKTCINSINPFNWLKVAREINHEKPDYVIIRYWLPFMAPCLGTIARMINKSIKIIAITDNIIPHESRIGDKYLTKYFTNSCDAFVCLSRSVLIDLAEFTKNSYKKFIPHPIYNTFGNKIDKNIALNNLGLDVNNKYLLFFGFIRQYKGLDLMLKAMSDTRIKDLGVKLIVAGEFYEDKSKYIDLISTLSIEDSVILKNNFISSDEVKNYFCGSDMITQTYKTATQSGITQIAYHFDRPMLVTNVGGLSEIVPHNEVGYVTSQDPVEIADSICDFFVNNREQQFSSNVKKEKERFSWVNFINDVDDLVGAVKSDSQ